MRREGGKKGTDGKREERRGLMRGRGRECGVGVKGGGKGRFIGGH